MLDSSPVMSKESSTGSEKEFPNAQLKKISTLVQSNTMQHNIVPDPLSERMDLTSQAEVCHVL